MATFAENITALRKELNSKRQEVADDLGISRSSLEYYEKGKRRPDIEVLAKFADYYGVSADFLIGRTSAKTTDKDLRFVCEYTGLNDVTVSKLHRNIGKSTIMCNQIIDFFMGDDAELSFIALSESFFDYQKAVSEYDEFKNMIDSLDIDVFRKTINERTDNVDLSEFRVQKTIKSLMEKYGTRKDELFTEKEIEFSKSIIALMINDSLSDGQEEGDNNADNPKAQK